MVNIIKDEKLGTNVDFLNDVRSECLTLLSGKGSTLPLYLTTCLFRRQQAYIMNSKHCQPQLAFGSWLCCTLISFQLYLSLSPFQSKLNNNLPSFRDPWFLIQSCWYGPSFGIFIWFLFLTDGLSYAFGVTPRSFPSEWVLGISSQLFIAFIVGLWSHGWIEEGLGFLFRVWQFFVIFIGGFF